MLFQACCMAFVRMGPLINSLSWQLTLMLARRSVSHCIRAHESFDKLSVSKSTRRYAHIFVAMQIRSIILHQGHLYPLMRYSGTQISDVL